MPSEAVTEAPVAPPMSPQTDLRVMSPAEWIKLQEEDPVIGKVREILQKRGDVSVSFHFKRPTGERPHLSP